MEPLANAKEQLDKVLKWTSEQSLLKSDNPKPIGNDSKSPKYDNTTRKENLDISSRPAMNLGSNLDTSNIYKPDMPSGTDGHFGGRRLSLAQRDKVVGGAAMVFAEQPISRESLHHGERRKSEYDVGRLSCASFLRPDITRLTEPKIEEGKMPTENISRQSNNEKINSESKGNSLFPRSGNNDQSKSIDASFLSQKSLFSRSEKKPEPEKDNIQEIDNHSRPEKRFILRTGSDSKPDQESGKSNISAFHKADHVTFKTENKESLPKPENVKTEIKSEKDKVFSTSPRSESSRSAEPKIEENKFQSTSNISSKHADTLQSGTKGKVISHVENAERTASKEDRDKVTTAPSHYHHPFDRGTLNSDSNSTPQKRSLALEEKDKNKEIRVAPSGNLNFKSLSDQNDGKITVQNLAENIKPGNEGTGTHSPYKNKANEDKFLGNKTTASDSVLTSSGVSDGLERGPLSKNATPAMILEKTVPRSKTPETQAELKTADKDPKMPRSSVTRVNETAETATFSRPSCQTAVSNQKNVTGNHPSTASGPTETVVQASPTRSDSVPTFQQKNNDSSLTSQQKRNSSAPTSQPRDNSVATSQPKSTGCDLSSQPKNNSSDSAYQPMNKSVPTTQQSTNSPVLTCQPKNSSAPTSQPKSNSYDLTSQHSNNNTGSKSCPRNNSAPTTQLSSALQSQPKSKSSPAPQPKNNSPAASTRPEPQPTCDILDVRPVTRSKSDVGEGHKGRAATTATARKSCAERRCCGARHRASEEAATPSRAPSRAPGPGRASSLSRALPMGSSASLAPKNKSSWTTQRALETEVQQLKRELQMHKAEELRLHREIHKLRVSLW